MFTISPIVQHSGTIVAPSSVTAIHAHNGIVFASTAVQTYILVGGNNIGSIPFSMTTLAPLAGDVSFAGSTDRTLRAIDFTIPGSPITLFRDDLPPSGGTINRVTSVATSGGRAYVGAGDIGIVDYDVSAFTAPFPMRSIAFAGATSIVSLGDNFYVGLPNGVTEFSQGLIRKRSWDGSRSDVVQDGANGFLLTSSDKSATLWALDTVGAVGTANFRASIVDAVLVGTTGYAVLSDRSLWSVDFSQASSTPQAIVTTGIQPVSIARSGTVRCRRW